ncbi:hypothetical protein [Methylotenera versatilis]|uniref:hypothetical protein n=1 Tax=Methylotenera versatilis TaxID=1055487 RepID=UPI000376B88D|nr:hypothetical protein [Methylotenera versatilis]
MFWLRKYLVALLPAIVIFGGWQSATWAYDYFGCQGNLKNLQPCFVGSVNILPFLGFGLFWCQLLMFVALPLSFWLVIKVVTMQFRVPNA